ncbi:unnamed protein product [Aspergillus oryzae var. brunneus]|uniref:Unnamed protein product n=1 Tax=Aspergillus oryzae var. brunneus TaxID=332754 RepID=A0ABQ6KK48_ASPOZ|nr:unnamed protein product [Aspergillus oryzae]GMG08475.1 unnamed protein product [Aspergillus oryzae]GMG45557.1 unnamed protein product [Aspergillus oryzae var. brunneus]
MCKKTARDNPAYVCTVCQPQRFAIHPTHPSAEDGIANECFLVNCPAASLGRYAAFLPHVSMGADELMQDDLHDHESGRLPHHSRLFYLLLRLRDWGLLG